MPPPNPIRSTVRRSLLNHKKMVEALLALSNTCSSGAQCPEVLTSTVATAALTDLSGKVVTATASAGTAVAARAAAVTAGKKSLKDFKQARTALATYETAVNGVAGGDAAIISKAGLDSRPEASPGTPELEKVVNLTSQPWKLQGQARIRWPATPGAAMYAVQASANPASPTYTSLGMTTRRTKVVKAPAPGAQILVQVAAVSSDGTQAEWSDAVLATAR